MNLADVALEALYVLGVLMCCALLSREEGSREGLGSRRARLFMLAVFCQVGVGRFGVSFSPCERRVSGRFGVGRSCWLLVIALVIA